MAKYDDNIVGWFTQNGVHIPIHDGETQTEASRKFFESKRSVTESNETKKNWELKRREEERKKIEGLHRSSGDERFAQLAEKSKEEAVSRRLREEQELREAQEYLKNRYKSLEGTEVKNPNDFIKSVNAAKADTDPKDAWRVTPHTPEEYKKLGAKMMTVGKSTVAVTKDGDIISVCRSRTLGSGTGKELLAVAVKNGGVKLDSFAGNHGFYCSQGFQPVSWVPFSEKDAPDDWHRSGAGPEAVIFYKYVGVGNVPKSDYSRESWASKVAPSKDYDAAKDARDKSIKK